VADAHIDADDVDLAAASGDCPFDLDGEGDEPSVGPPADGGGEDPGSTALQAARQLAG
jgi:hypothetical protein